MGRIREFIGECKRVLQVTKRPDKQEFTTIVKISALGIAVIGFIGFIITMIAQFIRGA
jgi:protein transport protein SEC61 subunit gamma-like protein